MFLRFGSSLKAPSAENRKLSQTVLTWNGSEYKFVFAIDCWSFFLFFFLLFFLFTWLWFLVAVLCPQLWFSSGLVISWLNYDLKWCKIMWNGQFVLRWPCAADRALKSKMNNQPAWSLANRITDRLLFFLCLFVVVSFFLFSSFFFVWMPGFSLLLFSSISIFSSSLGHLPTERPVCHYFYLWIDFTCLALTWPLMH